MKNRRASNAPMSMQTWEKSQNAGSAMSKVKFFVKIGDTVINEIIRELKKHDNDHAKGLVLSLQGSIDKAVITKDDSIYERNSHLTQDDVKNGEVAGLLSSLRFYSSIYEPHTASVLLAAHELILRLLGSREKRNILCSSYKSQLNELQSQLDDIHKETF